MDRQLLGGAGKRVAIVDGLRTPFAKQSSAYRDLSALDLGRIVVSELLQRYPGIEKHVQQLVFGQVIPSVLAPNVAREIVLSAGLRPEIESFTVARACATGYQAAVSAAEAIAAGSIDCAIVGGTDSASDIPMTLSRPLTTALLQMSKAKSLGQRLAALRAARLKDWKPIPPALKERSTGLTMGESAEKMAKENHIKREDQDALAHRSHERATTAWVSGHFKDQVMEVFVPPRFQTSLREDNLLRKDSRLEAYKSLRPVFDRKHGTVTAGNSSPLTDGASALLLIREDKAKALGLAPLGYIRSYAFTAIDPAGQMLMGPAYTMPIALDRAGLKLRDMQIVDMHEAFAAQVLSNTQAIESAEFAREKLGRTEAVGTIDWNIFNVDGGSIALGHPFAATGGRQILQTLHGLKRHSGNFGICSACAAGGIGAAMVLELQ